MTQKLDYIRCTVPYRAYGEGMHQTGISTESRTLIRQLTVKTGAKMYQSSKFVKLTPIPL